MPRMTNLKDIIGKSSPSAIKLSSHFVSRNLTPDAMTKNCVENITSILENKKEQKELFNSPRIVSKGAHYSYCLTEINKEGEKKPLLINRSAFHTDFGDLNYKDNETLEFFQGTMVTKENELTSIWKDLVANHRIFPYSQAYAGFQFGQFSGQLGDGRVVNLLTFNEQTVQIKGSGLTPFSRFADGKATLKASIREFIISESLHAIGIPTTRALILSFLPNLKARRGVKWEKTATLTRFAPSWIRLGNFDLQRWRQDLEGIIKLSDYCIENEMPERESFIPISHFIDIKKENDKYDLLGCTKYDYFIRNVVINNASSVAKWQAYGFTNGVLNTDNTSLIGLSMDYGPFSFVDVYDKEWTPNKDDSTKRYSLGNQPKIIWWNLVRFAESLTMLIGSGNKFLELVKKDPKEVNEQIAQYMTDRTIKIMEYIEKEYNFYYKLNYVKVMVQRLGLCSKKLGLEIDVSKATKADFDDLNKKLDNIQNKLIDRLLEVMNESKVDYNTFFIDFQNVDNIALIDESKKVFSQDIFKCFEHTHEGLNSFLNKKNLETIDSLFVAEKVDSNSSLYQNLRDFVEEYKTVWNSINENEKKISETKLNVSKKANPCFIPRGSNFDEVDESLSLNINDISKLEKLYMMSSHPYDKDQWNSDFLPEIQEKWTEKSNICKEKNSFLQSGCSS